MHQIFYRRFSICFPPTTAIAEGNSRVDRYLQVFDNNIK
jgi:hypothetical protein